MEKWSMGLFVLASSSAVLAIAGGVAMMLGAADFRGAAWAQSVEINPVVVGVAVAVLVGAPMAYASLALYRMTRNAGRATVGAGLVLVALVAVDWITVGQFSWTYVPLGALASFMFGAGTHLRRLVYISDHQRSATATDTSTGSNPADIFGPTEREWDRWANDGGRSSDDPRWATDIIDAERGLKGSAPSGATSTRPAEQPR